MPKRTRDEVEGVAQAAKTSDTIRICVGSYEHVLYGINATVRSTATDSLEAHFDPVYMFEAHTAQIKSCAIGGRYLASGGVDEVLKLYDLKQRRDLGSLLSHDGSITTIKFSRSVDGSVTHMLSGDENNRIIIWRCKDWTPLIQLTTRHGTVNDLSIHPSGKICISVGRDRNVRLWNLVTGKKAAAFKLGKEEPLKVQWNESGDAYGILFDKSIKLYDMSATLQHSFEAEKTRFHDFSWFKRSSDGIELLVVSQENGELKIYDPTSKSDVQTLTGHKARVKAISVQEVTLSDARKETVIVSGSTDGNIVVWATNKSTDFVQIGRYNCGDARITCLATCDAAVENIEGIVKRRMKQESSVDDDISVKEEEIETGVDGEDDGDESGDLQEEEFAGFD